MPFSSAFNDTGYCMVHSNLLTLPNSSGVLTTTGMKKQRFESTTFGGGKELLPFVAKTGTSSKAPGIPGHGNGNFSVKQPFFPSGAAGTRPDCDPQLSTVFGIATGVVSAGVSVTYALSDAIQYLYWAQYDKTPGLTNPTHRYIFGGIPTAYRLSFNGRELTQTFTISAVYAPDSTNFAAGLYTGVDLPAAGALTTYPVEPVGLTTLGNQITSFGGSVTLDSNVMAESCGPFDISIDTGLVMRYDSFGSAYGFAATRGQRSVSGNFSFLNSDSSNLNNLKNKSFNKPTIAGVIVLGSTAGQIVTVNLTGLQLGQQNVKENGPWVEIDFGSTMASASAAGNTDECSIVLT